MRYRKDVVAMVDNGDGDGGDGGICRSGETPRWARGMMY